MTRTTAYPFGGATSRSFGRTPAFQSALFCPRGPVA